MTNYYTNSGRLYAATTAAQAQAARIMGYKQISIIKAAALMAAGIKAEPVTEYTIAFARISGAWR